MIIEKIAMVAFENGMGKVAVSVGGIRSALAGSLRNIRRLSQSAGAVGSQASKSMMAMKYTQANKMLKGITNRMYAPLNLASLSERLPVSTTAGAAQRIGLAGDINKLNKVRTSALLTGTHISPYQPASMRNLNVERSAIMADRAYGRNALRDGLNMQVPTSGSWLKKYPLLGKNLDAHTKQFYRL